MESTTTTLKEQKEAFVTGHEGGHPVEILLVIFAAPVGVLLYNALAPSIKGSSLAGGAILEALVLLLPMAINQTTLLYPMGIVLMATNLLIGVVLSSKAPSSNNRNNNNNNDSSTMAFVTCYRSAVFYLTFVAILAVDFAVFPRRFCKTETSGYGLMDLGAGNFVVAAGLVVHRKHHAKQKRKSIKWKRLLPLVGLGVIRLITNKGLEYQEHVSEYGVHWNFFFTLAAVSILAAIVPMGGGWAVAILVAYQWLLSRHGLQEYIESAPRTCELSTRLTFLCDLVAANREGLLGCIGYLALYLASAEVGRYCIWQAPTTKQQGRRLYSTSLVLFAVLGMLVQQQIPVSRRSTNASFCVWTLACSTMMLAWMHTATTMTMTPTTTTVVPPIFQAVNRHGLLVFLVANLLTGLVNLTVNTLQASDKEAMVILFCYQCAVGGSALILDHVLPSSRDTAAAATKNKAE